jgi:hypothetical protein
MSSDSDAERLARLVRVVRSDAPERFRLGCRAAFLAALAEVAPGAIHGKKRHAWTAADLDAVASATTRRLSANDELHCVASAGEVSASVRFAKGTLAYLWAELDPPVRALVYASVPPTSSARGRSVADDADPTASDPAPSSSDPVTLVDASDASPALTRLVLDEARAFAAKAAAAPPASPASSSSSPAPSFDPDAFADRLRDRLAETSLRPRAAWHVVWDEAVLGLAPRVDGPGARITFDAAFPRAPGWPSKEKGSRAEKASSPATIRFAAWRHEAEPPSITRAFVRFLGGGVGPGASFRVARAARLTFLALCFLGALWYRETCVEPEARGGLLDDVGAAFVDAFAATGVGAGFGDRIDGGGRGNEWSGASAKKAGAAPSSLAALETPLARVMCAAAPEVAPFALAGLFLVMGSYALGTFAKVAARMKRGRRPSAGSSQKKRQ